MSATIQADMPTIAQDGAELIENLDEFLLGLLTIHGSIQYDDYEYYDEVLTCTCNIASVVRRPAGETDSLLAAVERLRAAKLIGYEEHPTRPRLVGKKVYPAKSRVTLRASTAV